MTDDISTLSGAPVVAQPAAPDMSAILGPAPQPAAPQGDSTPSSVSPTVAPATPAAPQGDSTPSPAPVAGTPPTPGGQPSVWKNLVMGAIYGLAGSAGATHFGGGLARGAAGYVAGKQQEVENATAQKQLQFESIKAADSHILAVKQAQEADAATEEHKVNLIRNEQDVNEYAAERRMNPVFTISADNSADMNAQAVGGMNTLAQRNGGTIPPVTTTNKPATSSDPNHTITIYSPSNSDVTGNPNGTLKVVNDWRQVQGLPPLSQTDLQILGGKVAPGNYVAGVRQILSQAQQSLFTVPAPSDKPGENAATSAHLQQQIDSYKKSPTPDPLVVSLLQSQLSAFDSATKNQQTKADNAAAQTIAAEGPAKAQVAAQIKAAETKAEQVVMGNANLTGQAYLNSIPDAGRRNMIQGIGEGRIETNSSTFRSAAGQSLLQQVTQAYPGYDQTKASSYSAVRKDFTSGKTSTGINSYNTAIAHLGTMYDHVSGTNTAQIHNPFSDAHRQLDVDKQFVSTELAKAVSNGQMTEGEKDSILSSISGATVHSYQTRIKEAITLLDGKLGAYQQQWSNGMPSGVVAPVQIVSKQSQDTLDRISGNGSPQSAPIRPAGVPGNAVWNPQGNGGKGSWQIK